MTRRILYFESCDFENFPIGGTLTFSKQLVEHVDAEFYLVGFGDKTDPIGVWFPKVIKSRVINYFAIASVESIKLTKLPRRLVACYFLNKYLDLIWRESEKYDIVFTQSPELVFPLSRYKWRKMIFCFAGLTNSISNSRFEYLRFFGAKYEKLLMKKLNEKFDLILAAADNFTIGEKIKKYNTLNLSIISFPTRFDAQVFKPIPRVHARLELNIPAEKIIIVTVGRLSRVKGWQDLIESFRKFLRVYPFSELIFIGDGEEKENIQEFSQSEINDGTISLVGFKSAREISVYLNSANIFAMFSYFEGWPTAMVEAIACGIPVVTSRVSGVAEMIDPGVNGFIVDDRDVENFALRLIDGLSLLNPNPSGLNIAKKYSNARLNRDFDNILNKCKL